MGSLERALLKAGYSAGAVRLAEIIAWLKHLDFYSLADLVGTESIASLEGVDLLHVEDARFLESIVTLLKTGSGNHLLLDEALPQDSAGKIVALVAPPPLGIEFMEVSLPLQIGMPRACVPCVRGIW